MFLQIMARPISCGSLAFMVILLAGCGGTADGPRLVSVSGEVKLNGEPLTAGDIVFRPTSDTGHAYAAKIENGKYQVDMEAGEKRVEITSIREIPGKTREDNPGEVVTATEQIIPHEYNAATTLSITVADSGDNTFPFDLKGNPPKQ